MLQSALPGHTKKCRVQTFIPVCTRLQTGTNGYFPHSYELSQKMFILLTKIMRNKSYGYK